MSKREAAVFVVGLTAALLLKAVASAFILGVLAAMALPRLVRHLGENWSWEHPPVSSLPHDMIEGQRRIRDMLPCSYGFFLSPAFSFWSDGTMTVWEESDVLRDTDFADLAIYKDHAGRLHAFLNGSSEFKKRKITMDEIGFGGHIDLASVRLVSSLKFRYFLKWELSARAKRDGVARDVMES